MKITSVDLHVDYPDMHRHWDSQSERFGGGDSLLTAIQNGWQVEEVIWSEEYWHAGTRPVVLFHFELTRLGGGRRDGKTAGQERVVMPVVSNPFVQRLLSTLKLEVRPLEKRTAEDVARKTA